MSDTRRPRDFSLALHAFTASGVLVGMAALVAVLDGSARLAIVWLLVAQLIDGIDGPLARRLLPDDDDPEYDGYVLDLVIDFVTCVLVPAAFLWQFGACGSAEPISRMTPAGSAGFLPRGT